MHHAVTVGQVELLTQEKFELIGENENLRKRIKQLQEQVAKPSGLRLDKAFMSKKKKTLQEEVEQLGNEVEELKTKLQAETEHQTALQQNLKFLQSAYQESKQDSEGWKRAADQAKAEAAGCRQQLQQLLAERASLVGRVTGMQGDQQALREANAGLEKEVFMLKKELAMSGSTGADGTAPGAVAGPGLKELLQENFHLTQQADVLKLQLTQAKEECMASVAAVTSEARSQFERLTAEYSLSLWEHCSTLLLDSWEGLCTVVVQHHSEVQSFREEVGDCSTANAELKLQLGCRTAELTAARREVEEQRSQLNAMFESLAHVQRKAEGLTEEVGTCERLKKENQLMALQNTRLQDNLQEKDRQLAATCESLHGAETSLAKKAALVRQLEEQVGQLLHRAEQAEADTLRRHMAETAAKRQLEDLRTEMNDMKGVAETQYIDTLTFSTQLDSLQASLHDAQSRLACEKSELTKLAAVKQQLDIEVDQLSSELFIAKSQRDEAVAVTEALRQQTAEVERLLAMVGERLQRTEADFSEVMLQRVLLTVERDHYWHRCGKLEEDCRHLRGQLMTAREQQEIHRAHVEDLRKQAEIDSRRQFMFIRELQAQLAATTAPAPATASPVFDGKRRHQRTLSMSSSQCPSEYSPCQSPEPPAGQFALPSWDSLPLNDGAPGVSEDELVLLDRVTRLQVTNWDLEERLKGAELRVQKLENSVARKDEVLQHWIAQRPITQEPPKRRLKGLLPAKSPTITQATQQQMQALVEHTTVQNLMLEEKLAVLQAELRTMQHHHLHCSLTTGPDQVPLCDSSQSTPTADPVTTAP